MDSLPWPTITAASGGWILTAAFVLALLRGWLWTNASVKEMQNAHARELERANAAAAREVEDANHERSEWRTEARINQQTVVELNEQNKAMLNAFGPTLTDFLESLRRLAFERGTKEVPHDQNP